MQRQINNRQSLIVNHKSSIINHQPSVINHQLSIINHQSSTTSHQPSVINRQLSTIGQQSSIIDHQSSISARIPILGVRPPRLWRKEISSSDVKWSLTQFDEYEERMRISSLDGMDRSIVSTRELLTIDFVILLREDYLSEGELTADTLRKVLKTYANEDNDETVDPGQFVRGVTGAVKMDMNLAVFARMSSVRLALKMFLKEYNMKLKSASGWDDRYGRLIMKAITKGNRPFEWCEQVKALVSLTEEAKSDPDVVWKILKELGQRQAIIDSGRNQGLSRSKRI